MLFSTLLLFQFLLPPRVGLLSVPLPKLDALEPAVRQQIETLQDSFSKLAANTLTTPGELREGYGLMGRLYQAYEFTEAAEACYLNAVRLAPDQFNSVYLLGSLYHRAGRLEEAILYYKTARDLEADYLPATINLGLIYLDLNRTVEAKKEFERALAKSPESANANFGLGRVALENADYEEAIRRFQSALEKVPDANRLHYLLGMAYRGAGDLEKARVHLEQRGPVGVRVPDPLVDALEGLLLGEKVQMVRGHIAFDAGRFEEAATAFALAAKANAESIEARVNLGTSLVRLGRTDDAMAAFREALELNPVNPTANFNLGTIHFQRGEFAESIGYFKEVLTVNARDVETNYHLARAHLQTGDAAEAYTYFTRVLTAAPDHEDALLGAANYLLQEARYKEALDRLEAAHRRYPDRGRTAHALAIVLAGCPDQSLRDGPRALDLAQKVYAALKTMGHGITVAQALAEVGRCDEAAALQRQLLAAAQQAGSAALEQRLSAELARYESGPPCRP